MAYANGKIPATALRRSTTGVSLRSDAAASLDRLAAEFEKDMKRPLKATDGYRELRGHEYAQEEIFFDRYQRKYCQYAPGRVDRRIGEKLMRLFQSLNKLGATILIASHDEALAERVGAAVLRLENGHLS